jgi:hypothetical protein
MTTGLAVLALILALAALILAVLGLRPSAAVSTTVARHRHGHTLREGSADPGAARSARTGGRPETPAYGPPTTELRAVSAEEADVTPTAERPRLPRPGEIGRPRA